MSAPLRGDPDPLPLEDGERHGVCTNVVICESSYFIRPYRSDVVCRAPAAIPAAHGRSHVLLFVSMSAFGFAGIAMVIAFVMMVERLM